MGEGSKNLINVTVAVRGAELYEKIGKGKKAIPKLLEVARRDKNGAIQSYRTIREFIERNSGEEHRKSGTGTRRQNRYLSSFNPRGNCP